MFENLNDVVRHCDGSLHDAGLAPGIAIVMYDMRCAPFDDIVACENPDLMRNVGIDDAKASGLGLIDVTNREAVHPLAVEYPHDPFENPKPLIQGHHPFNHVTLSVDDLTWFEIFFKLLSEKGNYKLNYYIPSRVRCKVTVSALNVTLKPPHLDSLERSRVGMPAQSSSKQIRAT